MKPNLKRVFIFGWQGFKRKGNVGWSVVLVMLLAVFAVSAFVFFKQESRDLIEQTRQKIDISVYFKKETSEEKIINIKEQIMKSVPGLQEVSYVSPSRAQEIFIERHQNDPLYLEALQYTQNNPFLPSLDMRASSAQSYSDIAGWLERDSVKPLIERISYNNAKNVIERFFQMARVFETVGFVVLAALSLLVILALFSALRLTIFALRNEIVAGRLMGASKWFLRGPFLVQGFIYGVISIVAFDCLLFAGALFFNYKFKDIFLDFNLLRYLKANFLILLGWQVIFVTVVTFVSVLLVIRKHLKHHLI